jgi:hypothetical protein
VPKVVEPHLPDPGRNARRLEATGRLRPIQRRPELRVREDQIVVVAENRPQLPLLQLEREPI